jgi:hypothetical protein
MRRILAPVLIGCLVLGAAGSASAAELKLSMAADVDPSVTPIPQPDGTLAYGWLGDVPVQVFDAELIADDGQPVVNSCLTVGRIEIMDSRLRVLDGAGCTNTEGKWRFVLTSNRVKAPTVLSAQLLQPTTTQDGRPVSAVASNTIVATIAPRIVITSHGGAGGARAPIAGVVKIPTPQKLGTVVLARKQGTTWKQLASSKTDAAGRFKFTVDRGRLGTKSVFRIRYVTVKNTLWSPSTFQLTITWV